MEPADQWLVSCFSFYLCFNDEWMPGGDDGGNGDKVSLMLLDSNIVIHIVVGNHNIFQT